MEPERRLQRIASCRILSCSSLADGVFSLTAEHPGIADSASAGQFVNVYLRDSATLLPRPLSICEVDRGRGTVTVVFAVIGSGTREMAGYRAGESVRLLGPLGNGFTLPRQGRRSLLIAGGVGTPPMVELAKRLAGDVAVYLGFRSQPYLVERLREYAAVHVATDDGSYGRRGSVIDLLQEQSAEGDEYFACGPKPMLEAVQRWAGSRALSGQMSLEERMGCGIGTCVGCVVRIRDGSAQGWSYNKVCRDGPVFRGEKVLF